MKRVSGWGRFPMLQTRMIAPRSVAALKTAVLGHPSLIARGNGRSYGDSSINRAVTVDMQHLNKMLDFDPQTGVLSAQTGVLLADIIRAFLPRGFFPQVTPGTKFVTLGGAIAADVHGKNHHKDGSFRTCVESVDVMGPDGEITRCSRDQDPELFDYTLGGMGLTGMIVQAAIRLRPVQSAWIRQKTVPAPDLSSAMKAFEAGHDATYSVAWIDCLAKGKNLGRSLVMFGEHATPNDLHGDAARRPLHTPALKKRRVPFDFPSFALNTFAVKAFNAFYYKAGLKKAGDVIVDWDTYFYPLDAISDWNRIYGRNGFAQYQCVLPMAQSHQGLTALLDVIAQTGQGSFLAVLKRFGPQDSAFSFPTEGYTLALDFPANLKTLALMDKLDRITLEHGGRFYLAKDSRMHGDVFRASDARIEAFQALRRQRGMDSRFKSAQTERLSL